MFFSNIEEITMDMFFGIPYYIENLYKIAVHYENVVKSRKLTNISTKVA